MVSIFILAVILACCLLWLNRDAGDIKLPALGISVLLFFVVTTPAYFMERSSQGKDTMVLNGFVTSKARERTSCSHSYSCNCRMVTSGKTSSMQCDTCYEHSHDYDWVVRSTVGKSYIGRIDRQGVAEPPRFTQAYIHEPYSIEVDYFNYIRASPLSVFKDYNAYEKVAIPNYPKVFDYYKVRHTVDWHSHYKQGIKSIDAMLADKLKYSSAKAKANVVVIFYSGTDDLIEATKVKQFGGRINDLTVMIRANKDGLIQKVGVFSWSKSDMVNVKLRDDILGLGTLNEENNKKLVDILDTTLVKYYQHRDNEEFKYLENNIQTPTWIYIYSVIWLFAILGINFFLLRK